MEGPGRYPGPRGGRYVPPATRVVGKRLSLWRDILPLRSALVNEARDQGR